MIRSSATATWSRRPATAGEPMAERTAWRICSDNGWWSVFGKKRGKNGKVGPPVHDDLVRAGLHRRSSKSVVAERHYRASDR